MIEAISLSERVRALCVGHPHAKVAWPHRELHEAADALEAALRALMEVKDAVPVNPQHAFTTWTIPHSTFMACADVRQMLEGTAAVTKYRPGDAITVRATNETAA